MNKNLISIHYSLCSDSIDQFLPGSLSDYVGSTAGGRADGTSALRRELAQ
jgi:hypothetical protein